MLHLVTSFVTPKTQCFGLLTDVLEILVKLTLMVYTCNPIVLEVGSVI